MLRTDSEYMSSLRDGRSVYYRGKKVEDITSHQVLSAAVRHASLVYRWQASPETRALTVAQDREHGGEVSRFFTVPRSSQDLMERFELVYRTTRMGRGGTFNIIKAIGSDALFALMIVSKAVDREAGTDYSSRVQRYYSHVLDTDPAIAVAQTDVKGDRLLRPHEQEDPDMYVRIVERRSDGIVVRGGAKSHTTQAPVSNEIIVLPTRAMSQEDSDYAVAFAVPANAPGLKMVAKPEPAAEAALTDPPWFVLGRENIETESLTVFDDVFVPPWDRVFLAGEWRAASALSLMFPTFHRFTAISYRAGIGDLFTGLAKLLAEYNGVDDRSHIRRDVVEAIRYKELLRATAIAAAVNCRVDRETGIAIPDTVFTNVGKLVANTGYLDMVKALVDVAGGLASTMPSSQDFSGELGELVAKYLKGRKALTPPWRGHGSSP